MERAGVRTDSNVSLHKPSTWLQQGKVLVAATSGVSGGGGWKAEHVDTGRQQLDYPLEALLGAPSVLSDEYTGI